MYINLIFVLYIYDVFIVGILHITYTLHITHITRTFRPTFQDVRCCNLVRSFWGVGVEEILSLKYHEK